ncbi:MAG TPA: choice-of-anchor D domain-containing protein [Terriglobales bacterium]|nr:choice-of-anchor D domain-containing protein [Terriglobales bacterium]
MDRHLSYSVKYGVALAGLLLCSCLPARAQSLMTVRRAVHQDLSLPLRDLIKQAPPATLAKREAEPVRRIPLPQGLAPLAEDPVLQRTVVAGTPAVATSFEGLGQGQYGFIVNSAPPDTNGAVGATQFVQWVNQSFAIFDKATGVKIAGPTLGKTLWAGFGGGCATNNDGDPIVLYDKAAQRWVFSQFSVSSTPFLQCIAVSTTSDATGAYHRYSFQYNNFDDYPKMGVWSDAYYETFNMFKGNKFVGADACAYHRAAMLAGNAATQICFQQGSSIGGLLPADLDGTTVPPSGSPNYMIFFGTNNLNLFKFHVDFATPANSTFTGPTVIPVAAFNPLCNGGACVPQPGTTQRLDSLADRLMYRLAYRNFGTHESLVVNHSVAVGSGGGGLRWYEIQNPSGTPAVAQQGTFAPDASFRWMGSVAMDQAGDMAIGYSVSSSSVHPSVRYAGRVATDPSGTLEAEVNVISGTGSQNGNLSRWGDYSALTVDPVDDCTFWYTQEYMKATGSFNWNTRIANFKFPNCGDPVVSLSATKLTFPKTVIGRTSIAKSVTLTNTGNATLNISSVKVTGDFAISANSCGTQVAAAASCKVSLTFTPTAKGMRTGALAFNDNAPGSPQTVALVGTGTQIALSPVSLNFKTVTVGQTSPSQTVTVTNVGATVVTFTSFSIGGTNPDDYLITNNTCGASLAGGASCAISVAFKPTITGTRKASLKVADNGGGSPQAASMTGIGG